MLWSLIKILLFIGIVAALTYGAGMLMETGGGIRVSVGTIEFNLGPLQATIALVALLVALWVLLKLASLGVAILKFLSGDETAISRWANRNRERRGYEALSEALMALASGEARAAMTKASKAERYLHRPELTTLITAQAAEMTGDARKAEDVYRTLLQDDRTRFVGVRGIMKQKLAAGDTDTAMKLAERAFVLKPRHEETQDILLRLQAEKGDWTGARQTLGAKLKYGTLPRNVHRRRDAVLALGEAKSVAEEGKSIEAREAAIQANKLSPDLVPAAALAARSYTEQGQKRNAARVLQKAWGAQPHPDLAAAFAAIEPDESPAQRIRRFQALTNQNRSHRETRLLLAELNILAEDFDTARKAIGDLATKDPTARSLTIMAAIERGQGSEDSVVRGYLTEAVQASRGPQWVCDSCQNIPGAWVPVCPNCGAFDTLSWRVPKSGNGQAGPVASAGMLPMIVGSPQTVDAAADEPADADADGQPDAPGGENETSMTDPLVLERPMPNGAAASSEGEQKTG